MHLGVAGQQRGGALCQQLAQLGHCGVGHLGHVEPGEAALSVDHEQRRRVGDLAALDRRLDPVALPHLPQLWQGTGEEPPGVEHPVQLRVGPDVLERGRGGIGVDPQQLDLTARLAQHCLGVQHRRGGERADGRALRVVEGQDHHLAAEGVKRGGLPELVRQREIGSRAGHRRARIQIRILRQRVGLGLSRAARSHDDDRDRGERDQQQRGARKRQQPAA